MITVFNIPTKSISGGFTLDMAKQKELFLGMVDPAKRIGLLNSTPVKDIDRNTELFINASVSYYMNGNLKEFVEEQAAAILAAITDSVNITPSFSAEDPFPSSYSPFPSVDYIDIIVIPESELERNIRLRTPANSMSTSISYSDGESILSGSSDKISLNSSVTFNNRQALSPSDILMERICMKYSSLLNSRIDGVENMNQGRKDIAMFLAKRDGVKRTVHEIISTFSTKSSQSAIQILPKYDSPIPLLIEDIIAFYYNPGRVEKHTPEPITVGKLIERVKLSTSTNTPQNYTRLNSSNIEQFLASTDVMQRYELYE